MRIHTYQHVHRNVHVIEMCMRSLIARIYLSYYCNILYIYILYPKVTILGGVIDWGEACDVLLSY